MEGYEGFLVEQVIISELDEKKSERQKLAEICLVIY